MDFQGVVNVNNLISSTWGREGGFYFLGKPCSFLNPKLFIVMIILHLYGVLTLRNPYLLSLHSSTPNFFLFSNIQLILFHKLCIVIIIIIKRFNHWILLEYGTFAFGLYTRKTRKRFILNALKIVNFIFLFQVNLPYVPVSWSSSSSTKLQLQPTQSMFSLARWWLYENHTHPFPLLIEVISFFFEIFGL